MKNKLLSSSNTQSGFTLVELLISLTLFALITAFLLGAFRYGRLAQDVIRNSSRAGSVQSAQTFLDRTLSTAMPLYGNNSQQESGIIFMGEKDRLRFVSNVEGYTTLAGPHVFEFSFAKQKNSLVMRQVLFRRDSLVEMERQQPQTILTGVAGLEFFYFGAATSKRKPIWLDQWANTGAIPLLTEIRVRFVDGDKRSWPKFFVRHHLQN